MSGNSDYLIMVPIYELLTDDVPVKVSSDTFGPNKSENVGVVSISKL